MDINSLRTSLLHINTSLLNIIEERRDLTVEVHAYKRQRSLESYDPKHELNLFNKLADPLKQMDLKELLAFSLIMETQAGNDYPRFSERIHLQMIDHLIYEQINPLALKVYDDKLFNKLNLTRKYEVIFNEL